MIEETANPFELMSACDRIVLTSDDYTFDTPAKLLYKLAEHLVSREEKTLVFVAHSGETSFDWNIEKVHHGNFYQFWDSTEPAIEKTVSIMDERRIKRKERHSDIKRYIANGRENYFSWTPPEHAYLKKYMALEEQSYADVWLIIDDFDEKRVDNDLFRTILAYGISYKIHVAVGVNHRVCHNCEFFNHPFWQFYWFHAKMWKAPVFESFYMWDKEITSRSSSWEMRRVFEFFLDLDK